MSCCMRDQVRERTQNLRDRRRLIGNVWLWRHVGAAIGDGRTVGSNSATEGKSIKTELESIWCQEVRWKLSVILEFPRMPLNLHLWHQCCDHNMAFTCTMHMRPTVCVKCPFSGKCPVLVCLCLLLCLPGMTCYDLWSESHQDTSHITPQPARQHKCNLRVSGKNNAECAPLNRCTRRSGKLIGHQQPQHWT